MSTSNPPRIFIYFHFSEKKIIDLDKPMRCGAFVDPSRVKQYTEEDFILPETPPFHWLLPKPKDDTSSLKSGPDEDRQSINSPTSAAVPVPAVASDENSSSNANNNSNLNNLNNNSGHSQKGLFEPMNFRLSQSPKGGEPNPAAVAGATAGSNSGSPPASLTTEFRRSSRWSIRQTGPEDERLLKELVSPSFVASKKNASSNQIVLSTIDHLFLLRQIRNGKQCRLQSLIFER